MQIHSQIFPQTVYCRGSQFGKEECARRVSPDLSPFIIASCPGLCFWGTGGCAGAPGAPDLSPFRIASCPVSYCWRAGVCRGVVPAGCAGVPGVCPYLSPFILASCSVFCCWGIGVRRGAVPGCLACLPICLPSAWEPDGGAGRPGNLQVLVSHHNLFMVVPGNP